MEYLISEFSLTNLANDRSGAVTALLALSGTTETQDLSGLGSSPSLLAAHRL